MNLDKQRMMAHAILKRTFEKQIDEGGDLANEANDLVNEFGEHGHELFSDTELLAFSYALLGQTPPSPED